MTLGRALQELGQHAEARAEFEYVLSLAPDNLAAIRGLAELHGEDVDAVPPFAAAAPPAPAPIALKPASAPEPVRESAPAFEPAPAPAPEPERFTPRVEMRDETPEPDFAALDASIAQADAASVADAERAAQIERLEIWLARIEQARDTAGDRSA